MFDYLIVGAGFAGSVLAERLARGSNKKVLVVDRRSHIGGNAYDCFDDHGILIHKYGPHIFHTASKEVFDFLSRFTDWRTATRTPQPGSGRALRRRRPRIRWSPSRCIERTRRRRQSSA